MSVRGLALAWGMFLISLSGQAVADSHYVCPNSIVAVHKNTISEMAGTFIKQAYSDLGCDVHLFTRPGKRALAEFNSKKFDGEVSRLAIVEGRYEQPFVRSAVPLFNIVGSLWQHPDETIQSTMPTGYVRGIFWQKKAMEGKKGVVFDSYVDMYKSYERGLIGSFLSPDLHVRVETEKGTIKTSPKHKEELFSAPVYHYLQAEFEPFMKAFSQHIGKTGYFQALH